MVPVLRVLAAPAQRALTGVIYQYCVRISYAEEFNAAAAAAHRSADNPGSRRASSFCCEGCMVSRRGNMEAAS